MTGAPPGPARAAFFDVDETVLAAKSMLEFLRHWLAAAGDDGTGFTAAVGELRARAAAGASRAEVNRAYFRRFAGADAAALAAAGRDWYAAYRRRPGGYVAAGLAAVAAHRAAGALVVLVSGSSRACLDPVAADLGADLVLCTEQRVDAAGRCTGEVRRPMIGAAKARAVRAVVRAYRLDPADCAAYGDHATDLDMLTAVGRPAVVGDDPVLRTHAARYGWPVLPARPVGRFPAWDDGVSGPGTASPSSR